MPARESIPVYLLKQTVKVFIFEKKSILFIYVICMNITKPSNHHRNLPISCVIPCLEEGIKGKKCCVVPSTIAPRAAELSHQ